MSTHLYLITGQCCTQWPLIIGVRPGKCGKCGERPQIIPGTERVVPYEPAGPRLVAQQEEN